MPLDFSIFAPDRLYLIVEDALTRSYLQAVWQTPVDLRIQLGGDNDGVRALVGLFEKEGYPNVFGLTDRDFRPSNRKDWENPRKTFRTFVLPVHEVENDLLDAQALHASP